MRFQVLLIDDSAMLRRIVANVLQAQPARYEVVAATRASEGFAKACGGDVAMVLVDERIAGGAGTGFCDRLLAEPRTTNVPVVLLLGRYADTPEPGTLPANVVDVLRKPFAPEQLASLVNAISARCKEGANLREMRRSLHIESTARERVFRTDQPLPPETFPEPGLPSPAAGSIRAALQAAATGTETGVVRFCPEGGTATEVYFDNGQLVVVTTRDGAAYSSGAEKILPAKVSPATLQEAAVEQERTSIPFLLTLGARGLVSKAAATELLRGFGQRHFARLWTLPTRSLRITFERLEALPGFALRLDPMDEPVDEWMLGTLRLLKPEDIASESRHQGTVGTPCMTPRGEAILQALPLDASEREFIRRVNGRHDLPTIARGRGLTAEEAFQLLHRFRCLEALEYRPAPLPFVLTPRTSRPRVLPLSR